MRFSIVSAREIGGVIGTAIVVVGCGWGQVVIQGMPYLPVPAARLDIAAPATSPGTSQTVDLKLLDANGKPVPAPQTLRFHTSASGASVDKSEVLIEKGSTSAQVTVTKNAPGLTEFAVEQVGTVSPAFSSKAQLSFTSGIAFAPKPPFFIAISVSPTARIRVGDSGTVVARLVDAKRREFPAPQAYTITFPEIAAQAAVDPVALTIGKGTSVGTAKVSAKQPIILPFRPSINPPSAILSSVSSLEFISPVVSAVAIPTHSYLEAIWPPRIELAVGLTDTRRNWIASDEDKTILLQADPDNIGVFESSVINLGKGQSAVKTYYRPLREGKILLTAVAGGLQSPQMTIEFRYVAYFFWIIAVIGGLAGGIVKKVYEGEKNLLKLLPGALVGCFTGLLVYILVPVLDFKSIEPVVQGASRVFSAFVYGFIGGGTGFALLDAFLKKFRPQKA